MSMPPRPEFVIVDARRAIIDEAHASPMIGRPAQAAVAGPAHVHGGSPPAFPAPLTDRRDPHVEPERVIVSRPQGP